MLPDSPSSAPGLLLRQRRAAGEHRRRAQELRPSRRRYRPSDDLRDVQAAAGQGKGAALKDPQTGLTHNFGGFPGEFACAIPVLGRAGLAASLHPAEALSEAGAYIMTAPPSTLKHCPTMSLAASDARKATILATSLGWVSLPMGCTLLSCSTNPGGSFS